MFEDMSLQDQLKRFRRPFSHMQTICLKARGLMENNSSSRPFWLDDTLCSSPTQSLQFLKVNKKILNYLSKSYSVGHTIAVSTEINSPPKQLMSITSTSSDPFLPYITFPENCLSLSKIRMKCSKLHYSSKVIVIEFSPILDKKQIEEKQVSVTSY